MSNILGNIQTFCLVFSTSGLDDHGDAEAGNQIFLPENQLPQKILIISDPRTIALESDPIAAQLVTDIDMQDEQSLEQSLPQSNDAVTVLDEQQPTCSKYVSGDVPNGNVANENVSPNIPIKRSWEPGCQRNNKKYATSDMQLQKFKINWSKISDNILERLNKLNEFKLNNPKTPFPESLRLKNPEMTSLVNNVVDQLRSIDTHIRASVMDAVAIQMVEKYPCLEFLDDDMCSDGLTHIPIKSKMVNHNSYLNRLRNEPPRANASAPKRNNRQAGTNQEYWNITASQCSKDVLSKLRRNEPTLLTAEFLLESQGFVRSQLDQKKDLSQILLDLPVLRRRQLLSYHFEQATGVHIEMMRTYYNSKKAKIIDFASTQKVHQLAQTSSDYDVFYFLATLMNENLDDLILKKEVGTSIDEIGDDTAGPVLICVDIGNGAQIYYVFADRTRLSEGTSDILSALQDLMTVHFVHGFMYLQSVAKFLELLQEYLLKIFPSKGSKSNAARVGRRQRTVRKVISALSLHGASTE